MALDFSSRATKPASAGGLDFSDRAHPPTFMDNVVDAGKALVGFVGHGVGTKAPSKLIEDAGNAAIGLAADTAMSAGARLGGKPKVQGPPATGVVGQYGRGLVESEQGAADTVAKFVPGGNALAIVSRRFGDAAVPAAQPRNALERGARMAGQMTLGAAAPGSVVQKVKNVIFPAAGATVAGEMAQAAGLDEQGQAIAQMVGGGVGSVAANIGTAPREPQDVADTALDKFRGKAKPNVDAMRARAQEYRDVGIQPTLTDITDESGRGVVRAAASRMTPGREVAQNFGDRRALDLPDRIGGQARAVMSPDARSPMQIATELSDARGTAADKAFGAVRAEPVTIAPEDLDILKIPDVSQAVSDAMRRERDPGARAALGQVLKFSTEGGQPPPLTVGAVDRISRVLLSKAQGLWSNDPDLATTLSKYGNALRDAAKKQSGGYEQALGDYAAQSRLIAGAGQGEDFLKRNTDEFTANVSGMSSEEAALARATGRRAVERAAGESIGSAPGVARRIAEAPEQQARNQALLGEQDASRLQQGMRLEELAVRNARDIAPRTGAQTQSRIQDAAEVAGGVAKTAGHFGRGEAIGGAIEGAKLWLKSRGLSDAQAEELVRIATTPGRTDEAVNALSRLSGRPASIRFMRRFGNSLAVASQRALPVASTAAVVSAPNALAPRQRRSQPATTSTEPR